MIPKRLFKMGVALLLVVGCSIDRTEVDVSEVEVNLKIERMDLGLFAASTDSMKLVNDELYERYGSFYELYISDIINMGMPSDPMVGFNLARFVYDPYVQEGYQEVAKQFADISDIEAELKKAFQYYKYHFPGELIPRVITYYSGFNVGVMPTQAELGIGLGMYLGADNPVTNALPHDRFPNYIKERMDRKFLVADAMTSWMHMQFFNLQGDDPSLLEQILAVGKVLYLVKSVMPDAEEAVLMRYSPEKMLWVNENEEDIWRTIVDKSILFTKDQREMDKMLQDGPFTSFLPKESPSRIGMWLGYRMVEDYMQANSNVALQDMVEEVDAQKIMKHYKPDR